MLESQKIQISAQVLEEAADWLMLLKSGEVAEQDYQRLDKWRSQSSEHAAAWERAESVIGAFSHVPATVVEGTLARAENADRRRAIRSLVLLLMLTPVCWLTYRQTGFWKYDLHTATGERKSAMLADGTNIDLNTATAVNVSLSSAQREISLVQGEIRITTGKHTAYPTPLKIITAQGVLTPLGTRFSVRQLEGRTLVSVFEGAVEVVPSNSTERVIVPAGFRRLFTQRDVSSEQSVVEDIALWEQGMLLARDMPLGQLVAELGRYRQGVLRCEPAVSDLRVSGAFPVDDTNASLELLQKTLPIKVNKTTDYWVSVVAR